LYKKKLRLHRHSADILLAVGAAVTVFVIINPYAVLRFADFWRYFHGVTSGKTSFPPNILAGYLDYLTGILPAATGWPLYLFALAGMAFLFLSSTVVEKAMLIFALLYVLRLGPPRFQALTYCLPLLPFIILFAVKTTVRISATRNGKLFSALVPVYTLLYSVSYKDLFATPNTRELASAWIEAHVPSTAVIAISKSDYWTPPVLKEYQPRYTVLSGTVPQRPLSEGILSLPDIARKADYVVITSDESNEYIRYAAEYPRENTALALVMADFVEVESFTNKISLYGVPFYRDYVTLDWMFPNPDIHILKRR
jgi:hypothetical protein